MTELKQAEATAHKRLLDYLDIHFYFQADTSANDAAAKAVRLRATRSLWVNFPLILNFCVNFWSQDPTYVDESWVGKDPQSHQPNPTAITLIPRIHSLIEQNYPGTKLSISEWASTNDNDITGGLVTVDVLGLFGKYGVDAATYWATPAELGPVGLAYWLYRGYVSFPLSLESFKHAPLILYSFRYGTYFGSSSAQVKLNTPLPDTQSVYAGLEKGKLSLVILNKNPDTPIAFDLSEVPSGKYFIRHFGGGAGVAKWQVGF